MGNIFLGIQDLVQNQVDPNYANTRIEINLNFTSDGLMLSPVSYAKLLVYLTEKNQIKADVYCLGEVVQSFERKMASALGKEKAIYMPTGTLANHIALRLHCPRGKKAIIHQESHINRDCGNTLSQLSGISILPISTPDFSFSSDTIEKALEYSSEEKVVTQLGVVSIETPVRRNNLQHFNFDLIKEVSVFARKNKVALHLDGARIFGAAALTQKKVEDFTELFDTVYVSLYKHFNSISGAILAGSKKHIDNLYNERRMFGGGLRAAWENIIVADFFLNEFEERFSKAQEIGKEFLSKLSENGNFRFEAFENGTNVYKLFPEQEAPVSFQRRLQNKGVEFPEYNSKENCFFIKINESILHFGIDRMLKLFNTKD